jgi:GNAT superfamily N-acetyltransferase
VIALRDMRPDEYDAYTAERERDTVESLSGVLPPDAAAAEARHGTERFLPDGLATPGHRLLVAESEEGDVVGHAWLGLAEPRTGSTETAWLYDIRVRPEHRRRGYAAAMLTALEAIARQAGARSLGLNVFGPTHGAIALYTASGYEVTTQQMAKRL